MHLGRASVPSPIHVEAARVVTERRSVGRYGVFATVFAAGWLVTNIGAIATSIADAYSVSLGVVGVIVAAQVATHAVLQVPAGRAVDRVGARRAVIIGLVLIAVSSGVGLLAPIAWLAIAARAVSGVGSALAFLGGSDALRGARSSVIAQGAYGGLAMASAGLAVGILPLVEPQLGWRASWLSALVLALGALAIVGLSHSPVVRARIRRREVYASIWTDRQLHRLALVYAATYATSVLTANWIVTYLKGDVGFSQRSSALAGSLVLLAGLIARPLGGVFAEVWPTHVRSLLIGCLLAGAGATASIATRPQVAITIVLTAIIGIAAGIPFGPCFAAAQRARPDQPATAVGFVNGAANLVIVAGVPLVGLSFSLPGDGRLGFAAIAGLWIVGLTSLPGLTIIDELRGGRDSTT